MLPKTLLGLLHEGRGLLRERGIETAALDARVMLQAATGVPYETVIASSDIIAPPEAAGRYRAMVKRRLLLEPVSRILGEREFYSRSFIVTPNVLDPRPDTETLIDEVLERFGPERAFRFADLGTGSGAIAVTIAAERPKSRGTATDISRAALNVARANARRHRVKSRLDFVWADWCDGLSGKYDVIIANPPYVESLAFADLPPDVRDHDPRLALDGGRDGLDAYRRIAAGASRHADLLILEIGAGQEEDVSAIFLEAGFCPEAMRRDLAGRPRCLSFRAAQGD